MKKKETKSKEMVKVPQSGLLSLVASKLKGRVLFPQKVEDAKKYLQKVNPENVSIEQYNKEIDEALEERAAGNFIAQEEMEKRAAKW